MLVKKIQLRALTKYTFFDTFILVYRLEIVIRVNTIYGYQLIIIEHQLNLGIRGLKIASRSNLEPGP